VTTDAELLPLETVLSESDLLIVAAPHNEYKGLDITVPAVDLFNVLGRGVRI
jgi:UDP-N-acetyl-D-mannosaminuronic acid dehydrogenase